MATAVNVNKIVIDYQDTVGDFPYTVTVFAKDVDTSASATTTDTNTGATDNDTFFTNMYSAADWDVVNL